MRNVFLALLLANLLLVAWQIWVEPVPASTQPDQSNGLILFALSSHQMAPEAVSSQGQFPMPGEAEIPVAADGTCLGVGPMVDFAASQQAGVQLAARGIDAIPMARDTQAWLGHWVQIGGFSSVPEAESALQRLIAGGLGDTYVMQDGAQPLLSLGVFQDLSRAERVASVARGLGFEVAMRDRYRSTVEQWLLVRPRPSQLLEPADLRLAGDRILRLERIGCVATTAPSVSTGEVMAPGQQQQPL